MNECRDWGSDGTHGIVPKKLFKQLYTIHAYYKGQDLPLNYAFLPRKDKNIFVKLFSMISKHLTFSPISLNVDFEKAVFSAAQVV